MKNRAERTHRLSDGPFAYVGDGLGVPGLPSPITRADAQAGGLMDLLAQALEAGVFAPIARVPEDQDQATA